MDLFGTIEIMRAFTYKYNMPEYNPEDSRGEIWGFSAEKFNKRFDVGIGNRNS